MLSATRVMSKCDSSASRATMSSQTRRICRVKSNGASMPIAGSKLAPGNCDAGFNQTAPGPGLVPARSLSRRRLGRFFAEGGLLGFGHLTVANADEFNHRTWTRVAKARRGQLD